MSTRRKVGGKRGRASGGAPRKRRYAALLESTMPLLLALLLLALPAGSAQAAPGDIAAVSSDAAGTLGDWASDWPVISSDGRYVAFRSAATNLVTPATSGLHVFHKDMVTGEVRLVSASAAGAQGNGLSYVSSISADGRYVAFYSDSTNLVTPATSGLHVFRKDMVTGEVRLVSASAEGTQGNGNSTASSISADGRYVAFNSYASNLVSGDTNGKLDVFRKDMMTGEVRLASASAAGAQGDGIVHPFDPDISLDGRFVCFTSDSTDLLAPATSGQEVFRKDMETGEVALVSASAAGAESNMGSGFPSCSGDGRYVSFYSEADNLLPGVPGGQVYRKDLVSGDIVLVSSDAVGNPADFGSTYSSVSEDGRYVALQSYATNLVGGDANGKLDIFRKDLVTWEMELVSASAAGVQGDDHSEFPAISGDGRYVAFHSSATNLIPTTTTTVQAFRKELAAPYRFFFAEGYTGAGFQEYLCLGNPSNGPIEVRVTYLFGDGPPKAEKYSVPSHSRVTRDVNALAGADRAVSIECECESTFIAERPMYFDYRGAWTGGHDAVGATATSTAWYFAEGYTGPGFEEWVCVMNPWSVPAELTFRFQTQEEGEKVVEGLSVPAHGRSSVLVNQLLGNRSYQTSLMLTSSLPVVAERPMYFNYQGTALWSWTGGHCVMGATSLRKAYFFAEGTTRRGFEEWLTLQNPGAADINVHAVYMLGTGGTVERDYPVPAGKRETVLVNDAVEGVGPEQDVSVRLSSGAPFLAERPMYFAYPGTAEWGWTGGHCVIGTPYPALDWFFAEGYTGDGFEEWLCIQNPDPDAAVVTVTYYPEGGGAITREPFTVKANSRSTVMVNAHAGAGIPTSARVSSTQPVIVERPMYFSYGPAGWTGGHDVLGYAVNAQD